MEPFKNLINPESVGRLSRAVVRAYPSFDESVFLANIDKALHPLELKQRVIYVACRLRETLPTNVPRSLRILTSSLQQDDRDSIGVSGFLTWPLTTFVSTHGVEYFDESLRALYAMTQVFTGEFDIRPFLIRYEAKTIARLYEWTEDPNDHVRRLVSEGTRPLLPWGERLPRFIGDPSLTWKLLDALKYDPSLYVRKSVANHINDHSKNHADWVVRQLRGWRKSDGGKSPRLDWIVKHSTRTLVKRGHPQALKLHGVHADSVRVLDASILSPSIRIGDSLKVRVTLKNVSKRQASIIVDHEIDFLKSNGRHSPKVFKGKKFLLSSGDYITLDMVIPIRQVTTRKYYSGVQYWAPRVNGVKFGKHEFVLRNSGRSTR